MAGDRWLVGTGKPCPSSRKLNKFVKRCNIATRVHSQVWCHKAYCSAPTGPSLTIQSDWTALPDPTRSRCICFPLHQPIGCVYCCTTGFILDKHALTNMQTKMQTWRLRTRANEQENTETNANGQRGPNSSTLYVVPFDSDSVATIYSVYSVRMWARANGGVPASII